MPHFFNSVSPSKCCHPAEIQRTSFLTQLTFGFHSKVCLGRHVVHRSHVSVFEADSLAFSHGRFQSIVLTKTAGHPVSSLTKCNLLILACLLPTMLPFQLLCRHALVYTNNTTVHKGCYGACAFAFLACAFF